jgi:isocitrate dehydrogenase (NAD+)
MPYTITLIPGDGIGPEITKAATRVIDAAGVKIDWEVHEAGFTAIEKYKDPLPQTVIDSIAKNKVALKGPLTTPVGTGFRSVNVALRKEFDLYSNLRPAKSFDGVKSRYENIDLIVVRENTEEFYSGIEHYIDAGKSAAETIGIVTRTGSERIIRFAFDYAVKHNRKKVTVVHKANILKYTSGLFLDIARNMAKEYPQIEMNDKIVDNMAMQMVINPNQFDVIVTTNLFGDILSDLASGLVGGLGLAPGANIGYNTSIFEAVHGSAPDIAGKNIANPCAIILAASMMLEHIGESEAGKKIASAVAEVVKDGKRVTKDLNPANPVTTDQMADAIIEKL